MFQVHHKVLLIDQNFSIPTFHNHKNGKGSTQRIPNNILKEFGEQGVNVDERAGYIRLHSD
jgi:hypothetical protein